MFFFPPKSLSEMMLQREVCMPLAGYSILPGCTSSLEVCFIR